MGNDSRGVGAWGFSLGVLTVASALVLAGAGAASAANVRGQVDIVRPVSGTVANSYVAQINSGDALAAGDINNSGFDEVVVAQGSGGRVTLHNPTGGVISSFDTAYDGSGDALAVGDITNDGAEEVVVANAGGSSENGRVDVLDFFGATISSFNTAYDTNDQLAIGDITGDGAADIVVANTEGGGRMDVLDLFGAVIGSFGNTGFDSNDSVAVADVDGDGRAEIIVANSEGSGRVDVYGGLGGLRHRWSSGVALPKVLADEMDSSRAGREIVLLSQSTTTPTPASVYTATGARLRTVNTTFQGGSATAPGIADLIALGDTRLGSMNEIIVGNS